MLGLAVSRLALGGVARRFARVGAWTYCFGHVADGGQHAQHVEEAVVVVGALQRPALVAFWERGEHLGGDELWAEQRGRGVGDGRLERHVAGLFVMWFLGFRGSEGEKKV